MSDGDEDAGTAASGIGLAIMTGLEKVWTLWRFVNSTRDMLADHITTGSHSAAQITGVMTVAQGGTGAGTAAGARSALGVIAANIGTGGLGFPGNVEDAIAFLNGNKRDETDGQFGSYPIYTPHGRANGVSGGLTAYIGTDGRVAVAPSSRRFKKDIASWSPDLQALLAVQLVQFHYKAGIVGRGVDAPLEHGVIAEELHDLGLTWLVAYDQDGAPFAVHYDKLVLGVLAITQDHERRIAALEGAR